MTTASRNQREGGLPFATRAMSMPKALLPLFRPGLMNPVPNTSPPGKPRGGRAVAELLLVLVFIGSVIGFLLVVNKQDDKKKHLTALVRRKELMSGHEVPLLGDEFSCAVRLVEHSAPGSPRPPYFLSRVQFANRHADRFDPFLIDIVSGVTPNSIKRAYCRNWTLMSAEAALDYLHEHDEIAIAPSELTEQERLSVLIDCLSSDVQLVTNLDEPLWRCVPAPLQETGIVVMTDGMVLGMHDFKGFPLHRLASAIRTAARDDDWTLDDSLALLQTNKIGDRVLTVDEKHAVAQSLVYRLLDYLPEDEPNNGKSGR